MKKIHIITLVLVAVAIGAIVSTFADSSTYSDFNEAKKSGADIHVVGQLELDKPLEYNPIKDANYFAFYLKDNKGESCKVVFRGTKPQDFERSEKIVLTGKMGEGCFEADKILMKCPSKYNKDQVEVNSNI